MFIVVDKERNIIGCHHILNFIKQFVKSQKDDVSVIKIVEG